MSKCFCHFNGYEVKDAAAREGLDLANARLGNLVANSGEQTEGNTELIDIRTGADGTVYPTAGDSVRGQITGLKSDLSKVKDAVYAVEGTVNLYNGQDADSLTIHNDNTRIATAVQAKSVIIPIHGGSIITIEKKLSSHFKIATTTETPAHNVLINDLYDDKNVTKQTIETTVNDNYLLIVLWHGTQDSITLESVLSTLKVYYGNTWINDELNFYKKTESLNGSPLNPELNIVTVNVSEWKYPFDDGITQETYLANWREYLNRTKFDVISMQEYKGEWSENVSVIGSVFRDNNYTLIEDDSFSFTKLLSLVPCTKIGLLELTRRIDDGRGTGTVVTAHTECHKALKTKFVFSGDEVIFYSVHLLPQGSLYDDSEAGYTSSELDTMRYNLRQLQYSEIIDDVELNGYSKVVILGDFNAQTISEYDIFLNNGFQMENGGYIGTYETLRDIPADNIITKGINVKFSEVTENVNLNTDHKPMSATIRI